MATRTPVVLVAGRLQGLQDADILTPQEPIDTDLDLYIDPAGNDTTGDGSSGSPYATLGRAQDHYSPLLPGSNTITVNVGEGEHDHSTSFDMVYPFGSALRFVGVAPELFLTVNVTNIDASHSTDANYPELQYFDCDIDLTGISGTAAAVGNVVRLAAGSGGTNPGAIEGFHEIIAESSGTATIRIWQTLNTPEIASGSITVSGFLFRSIVNFTGDTDGVVLSGTVAGGQWQDIVLKGNATAAANRTALLVTGGASFIASDNMGFINWLRGVSCSNMGFADLPGARISQCRDAALAASTNGALRCQSSTRVNGCEFAIWSNNAGVVIANTIRVIASAAVQSVLCQLGSYVSIQNALFLYDDGTATAVRAEDVSQVVATGTTITNFSTTYSPAANTVGNGHSFIVV